MNAPLTHPISSVCTITDDPLGLPGIFDPHIQLAQWHRPHITLIADWLAAHTRHLGSGVRQTLSPGQHPDLSDLPPGAGRDALATDIALLAGMLAELLDATTIGYRLETISKAMCPRLHLDRVGIRLLCTYRGPGLNSIQLC